MNACRIHILGVFGLDSARCYYAQLNILQSLVDWNSSGLTGCRVGGCSDVTLLDTWWYRCGVFGEFPKKLGVPYLGVLMIRIVLFRVRF